MFARTFLIDLAQRAIVTGAQAFLISLTVASAGEAAIVAAAAAGRKVPPKARRAGIGVHDEGQPRAAGKAAGRPVGTTAAS